MKLNEEMKQGLEQADKLSPLTEKWKPVLDATPKSRFVMTKDDMVARILENQEDWNKKNAGRIKIEESSVPNMQIGTSTGDGNGINTGAVRTFSPILIKMARRVVPNLVAMDFFGVQPMSGPDGQIFALRARYEDDSTTGISFADNEALHNEALSGFSGDGTAQTGDPSMFPQGHLRDRPSMEEPAAAPAYGQGMTSGTAQLLGSTNSWAKMGMTVEKSGVSARSRGLFTDYSHELRQDMMAVHGEDVDMILADILSTEIQVEMNREFIRLMNLSAQYGRQGTAYQWNTGTSSYDQVQRDGVYNITLDTDGRWSEERWKHMLFRLEQEANDIAKSTRRGKGNRVLVSSNVASALMVAGIIDFAPALQQHIGLNPDDATGRTYLGNLANGMMVYVDPYAVEDYMTVAFKGQNELDAGIFFCPYTPLEMYRAVGEDSMNARMAFKTRYGLVANPYEIKTAAGADRTGKGLGAQENSYFRKTLVGNL